MLKTFILELREEVCEALPEINLDSRANFFLAFENLMDARRFSAPHFPRSPVYRGPSMREKNRPEVEVGLGCLV